MSFLSELRRRNVFRVAAVYGVVAWLLIQIVATVEEPLGLPDWFDTAVIVLLAVGFPIAIILSWAPMQSTAGKTWRSCSRFPRVCSSRWNPKISHSMTALLNIAR